MSEVQPQRRPSKDEPAFPSRGVIAGIIFLGFVLRTKDLLGGRSLWLDEAKLALNLARLDFVALLKPLHDNQAAPIGFLWMEKLSAMALGNSEFAFRLPVYLASIAALPLLYLVARPILGRLGAAIALFLVAFSPVVVEYATEFKQYGVEMLVTLLVLLAGDFYLRRQGDLSSLIVLGFTGVAMLAFSFPAAFVIGGVGLVLLCSEARAGRWSAVIRLAVVGAVVASAGLATYVFFVRPLHVNSSLMEFHEGRFLSFPPKSADDLEDSFRLVLKLFDTPLGLKSYGLAALLFAIGLVAQWRRGNRVWAGILFLPPFLTACAAALNRYPFSDRFVLFLAPILALGVAAGFEALLRSTDRRLVYTGRILAVIVFGVAIVRNVTERNFWLPREREELRPVLEYMQSRLEPGDAIYVFKGAIPAFAFYAEWAKNPIDVEGHTLIAGSGGNFFHEFDALAGLPRVWTVFSHLKREGGKGEANAVAQLNRLGRQLDQSIETGASVYLFDLSASGSGERPSAP
jgi:hypothetical protein